MIDIVTEEKTTFAELPARLEAGTTELQWNHHLGRGPGLSDGHRN